MMCPVTVSQTPWSWHATGWGQTTGLEPTHEPFEHVSLCVQALPSSHDVPSAWLG